MSEWVWIVVFIIFILIIIAVWWAFSGNTAVVNNGVGVVSNGGTVFQPGVGFVTTTTTTTGTGTGLSSSTIIIGLIVFFIIIALIIWAVYPRRPAVVPPPVVVPGPSPPINVMVPAPAPATEYHHYFETQAPAPPPVVMASPPPVVAPPVLAAPAPRVVAAPVVAQGPFAPGPVGVGRDPYGHPATYSRSVAREPDSFDPDPITTTTYQPGYDVRGVVNHSQYGVVSGDLHKGGRLVTQTVDVGRHPVVAQGAPVPAAARQYIGPGTRGYVAAAAYA